MKTYLLTIALCLVALLSHELSAQCVTSFPYAEKFEQNAGNWTAGSLIASPSHTWAWGNPANKSVLNTAHSGTKCFMTGGLSGAYNANEESYIQSPCFDFTNLSNPYLSFYVRTNVPDTTAGINVWYSISGGAWTLLGNENDPGWYNAVDVFAKPGHATAFVPDVPGFSSNPRRGRLGYKTTPWSLMGIPVASLAGQANVRFRIYFAGNYNQAGQTFYEGASIDDVVISDYPKLSLTFGDSLETCPGIGLLLEAPHHPNITYSWSTGAATRSIIANTPGNYTCTISGPGGYTDADVITVLHTLPQSYGSLAGFTPAGAVCPGTPVTFYTPASHVYYSYFDPSGNLVSSLRYQAGQPWPSQYTSSDSGLHTVYVSDGSGCDIAYTGTISWLPSPTVNLGPDVSDCNSVGVSVFTLPVPPGVTWQFSFYDSTTQQWSILPATPSLTLTTSGALAVYVTDTNLGCTQDDTLGIQITHLAASVTTFPEYGQAEGKAKFAGASLPGPYLFDWDSSGVTTVVDSLTNLSAGNYYVVVFDANGCIDTVHYTITYETAVFPGDANHDQIANMTDLLPIGLHFGTTGPVRPNASLMWAPQSAPLWNSTQANGRDLRHVDTNGDGVINNADTLAITLNFGQTHNNLRGRNQGPRLHYQMPMGPHQAGDTLTIPVLIGDVDTPVVNLYGLVFTMHYDSSLVDSGSVRLDYSNSWMGTKNVNMLSMYRDDYTGQRIDFGMVRTDSMQRSGYGRLFDVIVVVEDHIGKRDIPFKMSFSEPYAIDLKADEIELSTESATTDISTALLSDLEKYIQVFPNPANSHLFIQYPTQYS